MIRDLSGNNPVKREQHLNIIIEETDRLTQLVNDMLDLSKLESGAQKLDYSTFDIAQCMKRSSTGMRACRSGWDITSI